MDPGLLNSPALIGSSNCWTAASRQIVSPVFGLLGTFSLPPLHLDVESVDDDGGYFSQSCSAATTPDDGPATCAFSDVDRPASACEEEFSGVDFVAAVECLELNTVDSCHEAVTRSPVHLRIVSSCPGAAPWRLNELDVIVRGPGGFRYPVTVTELTCGPASALQLEFLPLESGDYVVNAFYGPYMLPSCPVLVPVRRKLAVSPVPIVSFDVELSGSQSFLSKTTSQPDTKKMTIRKPWGVAFNRRTEEIYVADREHHVIQVWSPDGELSAEIGDDFNLFRPTGVAYDASRDQLIVSDKDNHRLVIFCCSTRHVVRTIGSKGRRDGQFLYPWGVAVSPDGSKIAVADSRNHRVQFLCAEDGHFLAKYSAPDARQYKSQFDYPRGLTFDLSGDSVFVTDFNLHAVFRISVDGSCCSRVISGKELSRPSGIQMNSTGQLFVTDSRNNALKIFRPDGTLLQSITSLSPRHMQCPTQLELPLDVSVTPAGYIALLDLNGRVSVF